MYKVKAQFVPGDISQREEITEMMRRVELLGGADIVVSLFSHSLCVSQVITNQNCQVNNAGTPKYYFL